LELYHFSKKLEHHVRKRATAKTTHTRNSVHNIIFGGRSWRSCSRWISTSFI